MKKIFFCLFLSLITNTIIGQSLSNVKHKYTDTFGKTMGENKVYRKGNEVFIEGFYYSQGIAGLNSIDYSLDIEEFNQYLYYVCSNSEYSYIYVTIIRLPQADKYGNKYPGERITIGRINTAESRRYKGYNYWVKEYNFMSMFYKDYQEYQQRIEKQRRNNGHGFMIIDAYYPKSIK